MKPYTDFNTQKGKKATNEADKNHFKLFNNAIYSKTMENMRKRIKIGIIKKEKGLIKYASRPTYINHDIFGKRLVAFHEKKELLTLNKPIYAGCTVLELSKLGIYIFHNDFMKNEFHFFNLLFTDTDSLCYVSNEYFYEIMYQNEEILDLSNYPKNTKYLCKDNKKVLDKMKDEYGGISIDEFKRLRPKMYSIRDVNKNEKGTHKGNNSHISGDEYYDKIFNKNVFRHEMTGIKSKKHKLFTYKNNKLSTSCFDDKRYI